MLILFVLCMLYRVEPKVISGVISTFDNFYFLERFCFAPHSGKATFDLQYVREDVNGVPTYNSLLMYWDGPTQWESVYKADKTCRQKEDTLREQQEEDQISVLKADSYLTCMQDNETQPTIHCNTRNTSRKVSYSSMDDENIVTHNNGFMGFQNSRARWWYFAVSNCDNPNGVIKMKYSLTLTNGESFWQKHVSADEHGILETDLVFLGLSIYLALTSAKVASVLIKRQLFHISFKIYIVSLLLKVIASLFTCTFRVLLGFTGIESLLLKYIGKALSGLAEVMFIVLLVLLAKGWTIVKGRLSIQGVVFMSITITVYLASYIIVLLYEAFMFDPGAVLYEYESIPGYFLVGCLIMLWIWFVKCVLFTWAKYPSKALFYLIYFITYSIWFLAKPVIVLVATFALQDHYREKAVNIVTHTNVFFGYAVFLIITRPSVTNKSFPFTIRTSQIAHRSSHEDIIDEAVQERGDLFLAGGPLNAREDAYYAGLNNQINNTESFEIGLNMNNPTTESFEMYPNEMYGPKIVPHD